MLLVSHITSVSALMQLTCRNDNLMLWLLMRHSYKIYRTGGKYVKQPLYRTSFLLSIVYILLMCIFVSGCTLDV
jgi:hypothetical protein